MGTVAESPMPPFALLEELDVVEVRCFHVGMAGVADIMQRVVLEAEEPALGRVLSQQLAFRLMEQVIPKSRSFSLRAWLAYGLPQPE